MIPIQKLQLLEENRSGPMLPPGATEHHIKSLEPSGEVISGNATRGGVTQMGRIGEGQGHVSREILFTPDKATGSRVFPPGKRQAKYGIGPDGDKVVISGKVEDAMRPGRAEQGPPGPPGMDLRMVWPERQLEIYKTKLWGTALGIGLPPLPDFLQLVGGKMPDSHEDLLHTPYADGMLALYQQLVDRKILAFEPAQVQLKSDIRWAYHTEWWQYEGHRIYALDATTAHALLNTNFDDFPVDQFHLPVRSFFIRLPRELGWRVSLYEWNTRAKVWANIDPSHPEPDQEMDGFMVTADEHNGQLKALSIVVAGRSARSPMEDHLMWVETPIWNRKTLGEVVTQSLTPDNAMPEDDDFDRKLLKLVYGAILYIISAHPELRAIAPPTPGRIAKARREPKQASKIKHRSRYIITYVGGPQQGFQAQEDDTPVESLVRRPPKPHMRAGHMRHVWLGHRGTAERQTEIRWIQPVMVGSWDRIAAWQMLQGMRLTIRKTRPAEMIIPEEVT